MIRDLSAVFSFAARRGIVADNPVARASVRKTDNLRERYLTLEEVGQLGAAFNEVKAAGANPKCVAIGRLFALAGCRRGEIPGLKWSEVDFDRGLLAWITLRPASRLDRLVPQRSFYYRASAGSPEQIMCSRPRLAMGTTKA